MYFTERQLALETIEPAAYKELDHTVTVGKNCSLGELNFVVKYSGRSRKLNVVLVCGRDFPARDFSGSLDTCVTIGLLPDRFLRKQTAIHRRSVNPMYNENFVFHVAADEDVYSRSLLFVTFYYDQYSHSHVLGEMQVPLVDLTLGDETIVRCFLQEASVSTKFSILFPFFFIISFDIYFFIYCGFRLCANSNFSTVFCEIRHVLAGVN